MNRYLLYLDDYAEEKRMAIIQNIRFWCVDLIERSGGVVEVTTSYEFTPDFLDSKGIPGDSILKKL